MSPNGLSSLPQFAALRHREFRFTWLASMGSSAAMWTTIVASSWIVFERSSGSGWVGIVTFAAMIPFLFVAPIGGLLGDMFDRRRIVILSFLFNGAVIAALAAISITGTLQLWHVAVLALVGGIARSIQEPALSALIPNQVPKEDLLNALILQGASRHGARFFGLIVAAPLLTFDQLGLNAVLVLSVTFQVLAAVAIAGVRTASSGETEPEHGIVRSLVDGLVFIYSHQALALFVLMVAFHCALVMSFESIMPSFSRDSLGADDPSIFNLLMMGFGAGSLTGMAAIAGVRSEKRKGQILLYTGVASGIAPILLAVSGSIPIALIFAATMGASQATFMALTNNYVQVMAPDRLRARISSLYVLHAGGIMAFANLGYGFMADIFTAPPVLITTGALFVVIVVSLAVGQPIMRNVYRTGQTAPA
ncbi:MAG: MFS transporter [SAR202 cluster bacterium]|nr:MFS transporter [SAR202 cluster bacterium]